MKIATKIRKPAIFYGWYIVAIGTLVSLAEAGLYNPVLSVFMRPMTEEFGWSRALISGAVTLGALGAAFSSPLLGPVLDRRGPPLVLIPSSIILGASLVAISKATALWQFYLFFALGRMTAVGAITLAVTVSISKWFVRKRGRAMAISLAGTRLGTAVLPILAQLLISLFDWRTAWLGLALLVWGITLFPSFFMRRSPEDMGLLPDGNPQDRIYGLTEAPVGQEQPAPARPEPSWTLREALGTRTLWLVTLAASQVTFAQGAINLHQLPYLLDMGISPAAGVGAIGLFAVTSALGSVLWGFLAERIRISYCMMLVFFASALGVGLLLLVRNAPMAYLYAVLYGIPFGGIQTMLYLVWAEYFGRPNVGAISGFAAPFQRITNALGPLFTGWLYDITGRYNQAFMILALSYLAGAGWMLLAGTPRQHTPKTLTSEP